MNSDENQKNEDLHEDQLNEDSHEHQQIEDEDDQLSDEDHYDDEQLSEVSTDDQLNELQQNEDEDDQLSDEDHYDDQSSEVSTEDELNENLHQEHHGWIDDFHEYQWNGPYNEIFEHVYTCFPISSLKRPALESGDKIIMPSSALDHLARLDIEYPMLFELKNTSAERTTHCGVLEFTADEGIVFLPNWMMEDMLLQEGNIVSLKITSLVKGKFVKFQPHSKDFLDISNPKAMLETSLRSYSCLTTGRTIMIPYNNKKYYIDVVETKPSPAISIIETDCEVDFAPPLDYKEPEKNLPSDLSDKEPPQVEEEPVTKVPKLIPFSGCGRRLDGKPSTQLVEQTSTPIMKQQQTENKINSSNRTSGKLVFGSNANAHNVQTQPKASLKSASQESSKKTDTPQFQAFTGKKYSLR